MEFWRGKYCNAEIASFSTVIFFVVNRNLRGRGGSIIPRKGLDHRYCKYK